MNSAMLRLTNWMGRVLSALAVGYVFYLLFGYYDQIDIHNFTADDWFVVSGYSVLYCCINLLLVLAWRNLLFGLDEKVSWAWSLKVYGTSQIAKYLPGNVFHFAGRHAMGVSAGVSGWRMAKSAMWEMGLISFSGVVVGLLALPLILPDATLILILGMLCALVFFSGWLLLSLFGQPLVSALVSYLTFLAISGVIFAALLRIVTGDELPWFSVAGAFVVAWLLGLVTPGAPAGVGVRELVLLALLNGIVAKNELILAVVLGRIVTVVGDVLFFSVATLSKVGETR